MGKTPRKHNLKSAVDKMNGMVGSYSTDHMDDEIGPNKLASVFGRMDEKRAKAFEQWGMQLGNRSDRKCSGVVAQLPQTLPRCWNPKRRWSGLLAKNHSQCIHFSELLLGDTDFS
jgi:hypothetical protein